MVFKNILINSSPSCTKNDVAANTAATLAGTGETRLTVLDVTSDLSWAMQYLAGNWENTIERLTGSKQKRLAELAEELGNRGLDTRSILAEGRLSAAIIAQVNKEQHDLVVKVAEDSSANRSGLIGSTDMRLIHDCPCAVLILRPDEQPGFQRAAVAVDVLDQNELQRTLDEQAVIVASELIDKHEDSLSVIYALPSMKSALTVSDVDKDVVTEEQLLDWEGQLGKAASTELQRLSEASPELRIQSHVLRGQAEVAIPEFVNSHGVDLLVIGSVARKGLEGYFLGNTAERILEQVSCSVLVLKPPQGTQTA